MENHILCQMSTKFDCKCMKELREKRDEKAKVIPILPNDWATSGINDGSFRMSNASSIPIFTDTSNTDVFAAPIEPTIEQTLRMDEPVRINTNELFNILDGDGDVEEITDEDEDENEPEPEPNVNRIVRNEQRA